MKKYQKPKMVAKNAPTGSYAAGCGAEGRNNRINCDECERVM